VRRFQQVIGHGQPRGRDRVDRLDADDDHQYNGHVDGRGQAAGLQA
jgi:hypothetical protein